MSRTRKSSDSDDEKILKANIQKRFNEIFSGKGEPLSHMSPQEVAALKTRLAELELQLKDHQNAENGSATSQARSWTAGKVDQEPDRSASQSNDTHKSGSPFSNVLSSLGSMLRGLGQSKIQGRLSLLILITTIPLLIAITTFISSQARSQLETYAVEDLQQNNEALATNIATWLELNVRSLEELVLLPDIIGMDAQQQEPVLQAMAQTHPYMYLVSTTDLTGVNVARNDGGKANDYSDRVWFQNARAGAQITYQSLIGKTSGKPALVVSMPIADQAGNVIGVGMFAADLTNLSEETRVRTLGQTGYTYIVDANNKVLAHPDQEFTSDELHDLSEYPPVAAMRGGQTGLFRFTDEQGNRWLAYVSVLENGWGIITQQQDAEILAPVRQFQSVVLVLIFGGAVTMLALSWFTIRRTLQPIHTLTNTVSAIAGGDLDRVAEVKTQDEIGTLAAAFNSMTSQLRGMIGALEERVTDRTRDLELASEVGRTVSQKVRNLDEMLTEAVEIIRTRFNLYYTQIYLVDHSTNSAILRAGTGEVGKELLRRQHRLPINSGSLNGRAISEKRAVVVGDATESNDFLPNPLLPNTRSEMAIPLIAAGDAVGVLDMQSEQPGSLNETNLPAFEALAGQLAIAIQNATLLTAAEDAREQVEAQARRLTQRGWQEFLDGIEHGEKIGYAFDQSQVVRLKPELLSSEPQDKNLTIPISVIGTKVGAISVPTEQDRSLTAGELEFIKTTSAQLAQHIENLRLLAQAERYRAEAELALRRLTRQGWENFKELQKDEAPGYTYDLIEVRPLPTMSNGNAASALKHPLAIQDEVIGELAIADADFPDEAREIVAAVAQQLSVHLESLRLSESNIMLLGETEERAKREQALREITSALRGSTDPAMIIRTAVREVGKILSRKTLVHMMPGGQTNISSDNGNSPDV